jgi:hypothetical protein
MPGMRLIAGSGRSGTTWVQDTLAYANNLRPVFEPLHPLASEIGTRYAYRALSADDDHPELRQFLIEVCAGRRRMLWTKYRRHRRSLLPPLDELRTMDAAVLLYRQWRKFLGQWPGLAIAGRRPDPLVKCIRANLMLGWLSRRCDCRTVLVVRHPGAVIESELRNAWDPEIALHRFRGDSRLHELTGNRYRALLERRLTPIEALAARWVIENQWVIEQAPANGVTVVFYERLMSSPNLEWSRLCRALDLPEVPSESVRARPSQQSSANRFAVTDGASNEPRWLSVLTSEQVELIQGLLDQVHFDLYTLSDPEPRDRTHRAAREGSTSLAQ